MSEIEQPETGQDDAYATVAVSNNYNSPGLWSEIKSAWPNLLRSLWNVVKTLALSLRALVFLIVKTPYMLVPSAMHTSADDTRYAERQIAEMTHLVDNLTALEAYQRDVIQQRWIDQISWTSKRANRERDANEIIRWWQIILGALIPVLANIDTGVASPALLVSLAGVFVAFLTAIHQFRRPEDRWRHYRIINERYENELWRFIALSGEPYARYKTAGQHREAFLEFNERMNKIKEEDLKRFFSDVVPQQETPQQQQPAAAPLPGQN